MPKRGVLLVLLTLLLIVVVGPWATAVPERGVQQASTQVATAIEIQGLDLHDGTIIKIDGVYHFYGTMYGCGFEWGMWSTPWCGFGVSTSRSLAGPWSAPTLLFSPQEMDPWAGVPWVQECGAVGSGCFNPRMIQRTWGPRDGVWILWFNAPADYSRSRANAYYAMGCNSPTGPCGNGAGAPYGSTIKPRLWQCGGNGDMALVQPGVHDAPWLFCTNADQTISQERLDVWGTGGTGAGGRIKGVSTAESPGAYRAADGTWIFTYSDINCGYCSGTGTSYATSTSLAGPWSTQAPTGWNAPANGRRSISATSCGGQPRVIDMLDGQAYQHIDLWYGQANQTTAGTLLAPLVWRGQPAVPGRPWQPFAPWSCR